MLRTYRCVLKRTTAVLLRAGLVSATALMAGAATAGASDNPSTDSAAPSIAPQEQRADPAAYAQFFFLDRLFAPSTPQQNSNSPRTRGGDTYIRSRDRLGNPGPTYRVIGATPRKAKTRSHGDQLKVRIAQQLRNAPPVPPTQGPLLLAVSIAKQTVTLYDAGVPVVTAPVSTGTASHPTPTGIFSVIEKQWWHRSNLYSAAPMPFMQRITWSGVALHSGDLPGYAASHGCIRLPESFALRLWGTTKIGARVVITRDEAVPVEIAHARLFAPKAKAEPALEPQPLPQPEPLAPPEKIAPPENKPVEEMSISDNGATFSLAARQIEQPVERTVVEAPLPQAEPSAPVIVRPPSYEGGPRVIVVPEAATDVAEADLEADDRNEVADNGLDDEVKAALQHLVLVDPEKSVINGTAEVIIARPGEPQETLLLAVEKMPDAGQPTPEPRVMLASLDAVSVALPRKALSDDTQLAARRRSGPREPTVEMSAVQPHVLRPGPISVLVSRKDQRMYVRKGFEPLFDVPVNIANPRESIGTYVFSAVAPGKDETSLRWMVLPVETSLNLEPAADARGKRARAPERKDNTAKVVAAASAALDRLGLPQDAVERISDLVSVGATVIVTERGLSRRDAAALDSDFTVQIDHSPAKPKAKPRPRRHVELIQPL